MKRFFVAAAISLSASVAVAQNEPYTAAVLIEPTTGQILFEKNAHTPLPVASMTKMMTLAIALDQLKEGTLTLDTPVKVSARASKMGGSQVFLKDGSSFPVRAMLAATMVHSANDAATALAEHMGGSNEAFAEIMNEKAQQLGMKNSKFYSPHGLPATAVPDDMMSAHDAAKLGIELMKNPMMRQLAVLQQMPFKNGTFETMYNPNRLLKIYPGATGIKTGFHNKAGFCVTGSARRGNMDLVVVVMGTPPARKAENFTAAAEILNRGFAQWRMQEVVKKGQRLKEEVTIKGGVTGSVPVVAGNGATILVKKTGKAGGAQIEVVPNNIEAPVTQGQQIGTIVVKKDGKVVQKIPALAAIAVAEMPWYRRLWPF